MSPRATRSLNVTAWTSFFPIAVLLFAVLGGVFRLFLIEWNDPYHCYSLITRGRWLDTEFTNWQPENCMMHMYTSPEIQQCLRSKRVVFIGDSTARQLFYAMAHLADPTLPTSPPSMFEKHADVSLPAGTGTWFDFFWDPFLNASKTETLLKGAGYSGRDRPAMLVLGSGLWYLRYRDEESGGGGISGWEARMEQVLEQIKVSMPALADEVLILPVLNPDFSKLSPERAAFIHKADIDAMNMDLLLRISPFTTAYDPPVFPHAGSPESQGPTTNSSSDATRNRPIPALFPSVFNSLLHPSQTLDGLHYSSLVTKAQSQIILNLRCNEHLPKRFPFDKTCCSRYPRAHWAQVFVLMCIVFGGIFLWVHYLGGDDEAAVQRLRPLLPGPEYQSSLMVLGAAVLFCYVADRTGLWVKEQKQFDSLVFGILCIFGLVTCILSSKRNPTDSGFLHRSQTDEWKGWMQVVILIYHYLGVPKHKGIYPVVHVLAASYLFMTGYGHTTFYLRTANYSAYRLAQVLVRLNLLTVILAYVMDTSYMFYYFVPLVSFWYIVIYLTLFIGSSRHDRTLFLTGKILISFGIVTLVHSQTWIIEQAFQLLKAFANVNWNPEDWVFRVKRDSLIVYVGMLVSIASTTSGLSGGSPKGSRLIDHPRWPWILRAALGVSVLAIVWFILFASSTKSKHTYNDWHPYVSIVPILAYLCLRNATQVLRETTSRVAEWIGKISLELYALHFHIWLAADTKGILVLVPGSSMRAVNLLVTTLCFLWTSRAVSVATKELTKLICGEATTDMSTTSSAHVVRNPPEAQSGPVTESTSAFVNSSIASVPAHFGSYEAAIDGTESIPLVPPSYDRSKDEMEHTVESSGDHPSSTTQEAHDEAGGIHTILPVTAPISTAPNQRLDKPSSLPIRLAVCVGVLWILNVVWPTVGGSPAG